MDDTETVYKVVTNHEGLHSAVIENPYALDYEPEQWIAAEIGRIFAFDTLNNARLFARKNWFWEVWSAEAQDVKPLIVRAFPGYVQSFWSKEKQHAVYRCDNGSTIITSSNTTSAPKGTVACAKLKLVEKVSTG